MQRQVHFQLCACSHIWTSKINIHVSYHQSILRGRYSRHPALCESCLYFVKELLQNSTDFFYAEGICVCVQVHMRVLEEEQKKKTFHEDSY